MNRLFVTFILFAVVLFAASSALCADPDNKLAQPAGSLLHGTVYKQSGAEREGTITIRMSWSLPTTAPAYRYDFNVISGTVEDTMYNYMLSDVASIEFMPPEGDRKPITVSLKNGKSQKIYPAHQTLLGKADMSLKQMDIITEGYGNSIVLGSDVKKVVFSTTKDDSASTVTEDLGKAIETARRDSLADTDMLQVLENLQKKLKEADRKTKSK